MDNIDFDTASRLCHTVKEDLQEMLAAIRDKSFYDVGYEIGQYAGGGQAFESVLPEFDELERHLNARDTHALEAMDWSMCALINHYDTLFDHIDSRRDHYPKGDEIIERLKIWKMNASALAQIVCQMDD